MKENSLSFAHIGLTAKDPIALERFYVKHFGFRRARVLALPDRQIVFLKRADLYLEIFAAEEKRPVPHPGADGPHYPGLRHLAFQVDDVEAKLAAMGGDATVTLGPISLENFAPGWKAVWIKDPEGNIIEISQGYEDEKEPPALK